MVSVRRVSSPPPPPDAELRRGRVVVACGHRKTREQLAERVRGRGFDVVQCHAIEAARVLLPALFAMDAVVLDLRYGSLQSIELLVEMRMADRTVPIIALMPPNEPMNCEMARLSGATEVLDSAFPVRQLVELLEAFATARA